MFRRNGDDLIDRWDGTHLLRTLRAVDQVLPYYCQSVGTLDTPALKVTVGEDANLPVVVAAVQSTFLGDPGLLSELAARDPIIAVIDSRYPGIRQVRQFDPFAAIVRSISAQQVNLRWAATTRQRLARTFGRRHVVGQHEVWSLDAETLARLQIADIRALQFTNRKAEYIIGLAEAVASGRLDLSALPSLADEEVIARLTALRGIGVWTAEWLLARTLGRPRVVAGDLGVRKAVGLAYLGGGLPTEEEVRRLTAQWGAAAGMAQALVLHALGEHQRPFIDRGAAP